MILTKCLLNDNMWFIELEKIALKIGVEQIELKIICRKWFWFSID